MSNPKIVCVVPSIRPEQMRAFREAWASLFEKHRVHLLVVNDGDRPWVSHFTPDGKLLSESAPGLENQFADRVLPAKDLDLFCRRTDAIRNVGFVAAAAMGADFVLTLDDDVAPNPGYDWEEVDGHKFFSKKITNDPIQAHLDALSLRVPLSWMNTAHMGAEYLRGVPYGVRDEAPVMLSHGVWVGVPDFDGETQLRLERCPAGCEGGTFYDRSPPTGCTACNGTGKNPAGVPKTLPYYVGPVPRGVLFPICGMSLMVRREALPYLYFAPMGADSGVPDLHRFADIFMGVYLKRMFDQKGWACYTGGATVLHTRASDATKNCQQEKVGREWMEWLHRFHTEDANLGGYGSPDFWKYLDRYDQQRIRFATLIRSIQEKS